MIDLASGIKFEFMCKQQLRGAQLDGTSLDDLVKNLEGEAKNLGLSVNSWAWGMQTSFDKAAESAIEEVKKLYTDWAANGKQRPPELT